MPAAVIGRYKEVTKGLFLHPRAPRNIPIYGYIYDVKSGRLIEVPAATVAGKAA